MSTLVKTINQNAVTIKVSVQYGGGWQYEYKDRGTEYTGSFNDGKPHTHALGFPHELHLKSDIWVFKLINIADVNAGFQTTIEWLQGNNIIQTWTETSIVEPDKVLIFGDDCTII